MTTPIDDLTRRALLDAPGIYLTGEDHLRLTTFGGVAGAIVVLEGRLVTPDGNIVPLSETQTPNSDRTAKQSLFPLAGGVLTNVQLRASSAGVLGGGVFAVLEIVRGLTTNAQALATLLQGYVTTNARLAWPGSPIVSSTAGAGRLRSITGTDPAAGVEISETVPAGVRWRLISFSAVLATSAVVANRSAFLLVDDGAAVFLSAGTAAVEAASSSIRHTWAAFGVTNSFGSPGYGAPIPDNVTLGPGFRLRTQTTSLDGGDNWGAPQYLVEEFIE